MKSRTTNQIRKQTNEILYSMTLLRVIKRRKKKVKWLFVCRLTKDNTPNELGTIVMMATLIKSKVHTVIFSIILIVLENWGAANAQQQQLQQTKGMCFDLWIHLCHTHTHSKNWMFRIKFSHFFSHITHFYVCYQQKI